MKRNIGTLDTLIRVAIALIITILFMKELIEGLLAMILGFIAIYLLLSGLIGCCSIYKLFGFRSYPPSSKEKDEAFHI
jgi:hypothetical protein